ncbi:MAG TPA: hypothetical protein VMR79_06790 [Verrucomicrobiae bacterium]|nr:hypothetical protein [Verrucomicrobiae bacterium]
MTRGSTALPAALAALAVSAALGAAVAELARIEVVLAVQRRAASVALAAADACAAEVVAALPVGWDLDAVPAGPDGRNGTPDDGVLATPAGCSGSARAAPGPADPPRALLRLEARAGGGRRALEALVGRDRAPGIPALLWLGAAPGAAVSGTLALDGADADGAAASDSPGLGAPDEPDALDRWLAGEGAHVVSSGRTLPALRSPPPPLVALGERVRAAGPRGAEALVPTATPPPSLALVQGDLVVSDALFGAGLLFVDGLLDIRGTLDFSGVVVATGGVRVASAGRLTIGGALWVGAPAAGGLLLDVAGDVALRQQSAAIATADRLLALPRRPVLLGVRDLG